MGKMSLEEYTEKFLEKLNNNKNYDYETKADKYLAIVKEDEKNNIKIIKEKCFDTLAILNRWNKYIYDEKMLLKNLNKQLSDTEDKLENFYKTSDDVRLTGMDAKLLKFKINKQPIVEKYNDIIEGQEILLEFVENTFDVFKFTLKRNCDQIIDLMKREENF